MNKQRGFTLVELLVVIAIIAVLAAILFPVFARVRAAARQEKCVSNLTQISKAFLMYANDYNQMMPTVGWVFRPTPDNAPLWTAMIMPYVKNRDLFRCPEAADAEYGEVWSQRARLSYGLNWFWGFPYQSSMDYVVSLSKVTRPAAAILVLDSVPIPPSADPLGGYMVTPFGFENRARVLPMNKPSGYATRHNEGVVVTFADGHAKWFRGDQLYARQSNGTPILQTNINAENLFDCNPAKLKWAVHMREVSNCP
ncbi:MAG: prepilin-type N-terminal cleavage/methylation domain-containing protein [Fimbriimonadales bacterium]|nr:prepilin-type N-terminal cleavage/methylation domain-containing protein [Fimbriimonadales bacterium]